MLGQSRDARDLPSLVSFLRFPELDSAGSPGHFISISSLVVLGGRESRNDAAAIETTCIVDHSLWGNLPICSLQCRHRVSKTIKRQMLFGLHDDAEDEDVGGARTMALADGTFSDTLVPGGGDSQADRQPKRAREESETPAKVPTRATDVRPRRSLNRMYDRMNQRLIAAMPQREQDGVEGHPRNENAVPVARKATAGRLSLREHTTATPDAAEGLRHTQTAMLNHQSGMITSLRLSSRAGRSPSPALLAQAAIMHSANRGHTTPVLSSEPNWAHATPVLFSEPGQTRKISSSTLQTASDTHLHEVAPSAAPSNPPIQLPVRTSSPEPDFVKMGAALRDEDAIVPKFRPAAVARAEEHLHDARKKVAPFMTAALERSDRRQSGIGTGAEAYSLLNRYGVEEVDEVAGAVAGIAINRAHLLARKRQLGLQQE
ncbi:hypothetical protein CAOG_008073 [Capsaspora owczarzaki ATCC 30864]|uniref:Uncharacterized protein n=1 Tax=Capsaspora owczarzaki (strain ATCC 30864) TaxID=595528 RepID=A0A0D2WXP6_CAPO3|nr:hypothetical protein CAOG_008073 [Capsaspora owczarzaki ATCC 30864]